MKKKLLALLLALVMLISCASLLSGCKDSGRRNRDETEDDDRRDRDDEDDKEDKKDKKDKKDDEDGEDNEGDEGDEADVVGDWSAKLDLSDAFAAYIDELMADELGGYLDYFDVDIDSLRISVLWDISLKENDRYTMNIEMDQDEIEGSVKSLARSIAAGVADAMVAESGMSRAEVEEELASEGMTWSDFVSELAYEMENAMDLEDMDLRENESGYYTVEGDRIYLLDSKDGKTKDAEWLEFERKGSKLVITDASRDFDELEDMGAANIFPITFKKS